MEFQDLVASSPVDIENTRDEARFSFLQGGYIEDPDLQGISSFFFTLTQSILAFELLFFIRLREAFLSGLLMDKKTLAKIGMSQIGWKSRQSIFSVYKSLKFLNSKL